jgi:hypothetical protein
LTGLVKKIDGFVGENKKAGAAAVVVFTAKESDELKAKLKKLAKDEKLELPLTINADGKTGERFKLDAKAKVTVFVYKAKKVTASFAFSEIGEKDIQAVLAAAKEAVKDA